MKFFTRKPAQERPQAFALACHQVGDSLVVAPPGPPRQPIAQWAEALPADPERAVVVLDLPNPENPWTWNAVANALHGRGAVRLVGAHTGSGEAACARWLADELDVEVVAPSGTLRLAGAGVFVETGRWRSFRPGMPPVQLGSRFPEPAWENALLELPDLGDDVRVVRIPAGLWLHRATTEITPFATTVRDLPYRLDSMTVVIGAPGAAAVRTDAVACLLAALPPAVRAVVRLAPFGTRVDGRMLGQIVADALGEPIVAYAGLPGAEVVAFAADGQPGWRPFATHLGYEPSTGGFGQPVVLGRRAPFDDIRVPGPAVYPLHDGTVVEVVQSGLWVRGNEVPSCASRIRTAPLDPEWIRVVVGDLEAATAPELASAATRLIEQLDADDKRMVRLTFGTAPKVPEPQPAPPPPVVVESPPPVPTVTSHVPVATATETQTEEPIAVRLTPPAVVEVSLPDLPEQDEPEEPVEFEPIDPDQRSTAEERDWLRNALGAQYDNYAGAVMRLMSRQPGLRAVEGEALEAIVTDLVAVLVYLDGADRTLGGRRPYACCLASGLQRLPSHRGLALHAGAGVATVEPGDIVSHKRFFNAVSTPTASLPGDAEFLVWSTTGRRVDDVDQSGQDGRIVFLPDRRFKVLDVRQDGGGPSRVFLREVIETDAGSAITERDRRILARLDLVAAARDSTRGREPVLTAEKQPWVLDGLDLAATA